MANCNYIKWSKANGINQYISVNTFSGTRRKADDKFELMNFYMDIDLKKLVLIKNYIISQIINMNL